MFLTFNLKNNYFCQIPQILLGKTPWKKTLSIRKPISEHFNNYLYSLKKINLSKIIYYKTILIV